MEPRSVEFFESTFALNETVPELALMEFAEAASAGVDGDTMEGMAAMLRLIKECVAPADVRRFMVLARKNHAGIEQLMPVVKAMFEGATERPTGRPSDSSDGPVLTVQKPVSSVVDKDSGPLRGRPDMQLAVARSA